MAFENECRLNEFMMGGLLRIAEDIPADQLASRPAGNGHPPIWILGHLEICAELGQQYFGVDLKHPDWVVKFGPGSSDEIADADTFAKEELVELIATEYAALRTCVEDADTKMLAEPHGVGLLEGSTLQTKEDILSHLLASHFAFHTAQLSSWRRAAGFGPLF